MASKRLPCSACGANPPFGKRVDWRIVALSGRALREEPRLVCDECLLPLRHKWAEQAKAS